MNFSIENYSKICQILIRREIKDHLYKGTDLILIKTRVKRSFYKGTKCFFLSTEYFGLSGRIFLERVDNIGVGRGKVVVYTLLMKVFRSVFSFY